MAEGKGAYSLIQSDIDLLTLFLGFTISSAIVFYISNNKIAIEKLLGLGIVAVLIGLVILTGFLMILYFFYTSNILFPSGYNSLFHYLYIILSFGMVISISIISSIFQGKSLFKVVNFITIFISSVNFIVFGILFYANIAHDSKFDVNDVLVISLAIYFLNLCIWIFCYKKHIGVVPRFNFNYSNEIKPLFIFITIGHLSQMINFLTYKMDYWIIDYYNGAKELGYYSQAAGLSLMFGAITSPIIIVLTPYLTSKNSRESLIYFKFYSRLNSTIIITCVALAVIFAGLIFPIYGKEFSNSVLPFRILSVGIIMSGITKIFAVYIYSQNQMKYNLISTIIAFFVTLVLDLILIPLYGSIGASIATAISYTALTIAVSYFLFIKFKIDSKNLFFLTRSDLLSIKSKMPFNLFKK